MVVWKVEREGGGVFDWGGGISIEDGDSVVGDARDRTCFLGVYQVGKSCVKLLYRQRRRCSG